MREKLRIAVCDDEAYYRQKIGELLSKYLDEKNVGYELSVFRSGKEFCGVCQNLLEYDIIFLDIEMEKMNGMETAYKIREKNEEMDIVFITVMSEYVFEGYKVGAVRYIMKNELDELLPECMGTLLKKWRYRGKRMEFSFVGGARNILPAELIYIESQAHRLKFVMKNDILYLYGQMGELEKRLSEFSFVRCHQSFLVNLNYIGKIKNYLIYLADGTELPVSRQKYAAIRQQFLLYKEI